MFMERGIDAAVAEVLVADGRGVVLVVVVAEGAVSS